jgi:TRAP-type C4-dicarboxylate transport system substrate-binding protein
MKTTTLPLLVASTLLACAACTDAPDKSGGGAPVTTLVMASNDGAGLENAPAVARFVDLVSELSDGQLEVEVTGKWYIAGEQKVLNSVATGEADLAWSGTRALDTIGVDSFRPLHAPFLVDSYAAQAAVLGDDLADEMLAGFEGTGLTGLAVLADELRFVASAEGPIRSADDLAGLEFGTFPSNTQTAALKALGTHVKALRTPHPPDTDGLHALETSWPTYLANRQVEFMPFASPDAVLWPRSTVLVANADLWSGLPEEDQGVLSEAAAEAAAWSLEHADDRVSAEVGRACRAGARIVATSHEQLQTLRAAAAPAYDALRSDPDQAATLRAIESLVSESGPETVEVPDGCAYRRGDEDRVAVSVLPAVLDGPGRTGALPQGTYRYELGHGEILDGGDFSEELATANAGVWTWTLRDGRWDYEIKLIAQELPAGYAGTTCEGYYDAVGDEVRFTTVTVYATGDCASETWKATWRETADGLAMDVTTDGDDLDFLFGSKPWERIG